MTDASLLFIMWLGSMNVGGAFAQTTYQANSQYGNGIVNASGQWANQIGAAGAQANRNAANQLFQQALQHESQGLATLNPGLLTQALTESQQGIQADDQARHLAQTSLEALRSGNSAGHVDLTTNYGVTESQLQDLANTSSPLLPTVQSHLGNYGIQVDHNANVIQTPFGQFPLSAGPGDITRDAGKVAEALGYSSDSVASGVQAAMANAQTIGRKAYADTTGGAANPKATSTAGGGNGKTDDLAALTPAKVATTAAKVKAAAVANDRDPASEYDMDARAAALAKSRAEMKEKYKLNSKATEIAEKSQNLFLLVHEHYLDLQRRGHFDITQQLASTRAAP